MVVVISTAALRNGLFGQVSTSGGRYAGAGSSSGGSVEGCVGQGESADEAAPDDANALAHMAAVTSALHRSKRVVAVVGAGISVSAGIPDFRSANGLYNLVKARYPQTVVRGRDMFDAALFRDPLSTQIFYTFIAELKVLSDAAQLTPTHNFLGSLRERGKLLRCYTQNIDCLEARLNLNFVRHPVSSASSASSSSSLAQSSAKPDSLHSLALPLTSSPTETTHPKPLPVSPSQPPQKSNKTRGSATAPPPLIHLHGALDTLICTICKTTVPYTPDHLATCQRGTPPPCPACAATASARADMGKRAVRAGVLRPNIVLYGEHHAGGDAIAAAVTVDGKKLAQGGGVGNAGGISGGGGSGGAGVLFVMGTSLKVDGVKMLVRQLARSVRDGGGCVVLLNRCRLGREWDGVFDYVVLGEVDECVSILEDGLKRLESAAASRGAGGRKKATAAAAAAANSTLAAQSPSQLKLTHMLKVVKDEAGTVTDVSAKGGSDRMNFVPAPPKFLEGESDSCEAPDGAASLADQENGPILRARPAATLGGRTTKSTGFTAVPSIANSSISTMTATLVKTRGSASATTSAAANSMSAISSAKPNKVTVPTRTTARMASSTSGTIAKKPLTLSAAKSNTRSEGAGTKSIHSLFQTVNATKSASFAFAGESPTKHVEMLSLRGGDDKDIGARPPMQLCRGMERQSVSTNAPEDEFVRVMDGCDGGSAGIVNVRSSSAVRKVGEGSPTKKTKFKTLDDVLGVQVV
ncbi:DHS-like NAD/FAD-binding domain-containing protein [Chytriomyces sp. MP71]|nr:DHS-like NAD/FAD-binding domain-containing protein [Chytriomyces sp. MP71]